MKIQIDTQEKTIKLEYSEQIGKLIEILEKLVGKNWREWTLLASTTISSQTYPSEIKLCPNYNPSYPVGWNNDTAQKLIDCR